MIIQLGTGNLTGWHLRPQVPTKINVHMVHMLVLNRLILTGYEPKVKHARELESPKVSNFNLARGKGQERGVKPRQKIRFTDF
jgi:hypothetical protein